MKKEGVRRPAGAAALQDASDGVEVTSKPAEEPCRPSKRSKGAVSTPKEVEMLGNSGTELPHNRFSCPEVIRRISWYALPSLSFLPHPPSPHEKKVVPALATP